MYLDLQIVEIMLSMLWLMRVMGVNLYLFQNMSDVVYMSFIYV